MITEQLSAPVLASLCITAYPPRNRGTRQKVVKEDRVAQFIEKHLLLKNMQKVVDYSNSTKHVTAEI